MSQQNLSAISMTAEALLPGVDREAIARCIELAIIRHGVDESDLEGTLDDADALLALLPSWPTIAIDPAGKGYPCQERAMTPAEVREAITTMLDQHEADRQRIAALERALFIAGAHCQGGHSRAGQAIAGLFGIPFPLRMENLAATAEQRGFATAELWPWYARTLLQEKTDV